jgi:hypothetical protein
MGVLFNAYLSRGREQHSVLKYQLVIESIPMQVNRPQTSGILLAHRGYSASHLDEVQSSRFSGIGNRQEREDVPH